MNFIVNISTCSVGEVQGNKLQWREIKLKRKIIPRHRWRVIREGKGGFLYVHLCPSRADVSVCCLSHRNLRQKTLQGRNSTLAEEVNIYVQYSQKGINDFIASVHSDNCPWAMTPFQSWRLPFLPYTLFIGTSDLIWGPNQSFPGHSSLCLHLFLAVYSYVRFVAVLLLRFNCHTSVSFCNAMKTISVNWSNAPTEGRVGKRVLQGGPVWLKNWSVRWDQATDREEWLVLVLGWPPFLGFSVVLQCSLSSAFRPLSWRYSL